MFSSELRDVFFQERMGGGRWMGHFRRLLKDRASPFLSFHLSPHLSPHLVSILKGRRGQPPGGRNRPLAALPQSLTSGGRAL